MTPFVYVRNKMHKAFPLPAIKFPLPVNKYKTARELWAVILKTYGGNEATKKTKKNFLKQQYGNFKAEGSETLEQTFTRLQVNVGQLQFMDVEVEQDDLNQKFLTSLAPEWLMHTIVWRNRSDLDTMSLDYLYNHLKVYESEVQKKSEPNTQHMAFISSAKHSRGNDEVNTSSVYTASSNVSTASANVATGSKAEEQAPKALMVIDGVGWDWSYMTNNEEDHALVADEEAPIEFALMANTSTESKECIESLKKELETLKQEKEVVDGKLAGLLTASKDLDNLIEGQRSDKKCADDIVTDYSRPSSTIESSSKEDQNINPLVFEKVASPITPKPFVKFVKASDSKSKSKTDEKETPKKPRVKYAEEYRKPNKKPNVRGNKRNWNNLKSHQLGPDFVMKKKACFNCGDFNHLAYEFRKKVKTQYRAPWMSTVNRNFPPVNRKFSTGSRNFPTVNRKFSTASRKFPTGSTKKNPIANMGMKGKGVKPSACWTWKPLQNLSNKGPKNNSVSVMFKKYTYIDTQGRLKYMTGNISYLSDYEPFEGGYVSFGQGGCKITRKGTIKTGKLKFENVYFVKDLKYNLFSVSQICDNKNSVLFTNSECIVLGRDFKLLDDANILLRTPRQHNMYSIDLNNIVPHRDLTCLVAKAFADECMI
nr:ribonuclease H-like domain-containing protein [Tanacetum cinerariifolium]